MDVYVVMSHIAYEKRTCIEKIFDTVDKAVAYCEGIVGVNKNYHTASSREFPYNLDWELSNREYYNITKIITE